MVAGAHVARAEPNGYTLLVTSSANVTNPQGVAMPYDVIADFAPVGDDPGRAAADPHRSSVGAVQVGGRARRLRQGQSRQAQLRQRRRRHRERARDRAARRARPGSRSSMCPTAASTQAGVAVVAGEIQGSFVFQGAAKPLVMEGKARGLASTADKRAADWPELPTMAESGFPEFVHQGFVGLVAPAKTPPAIVALLNKHVNEIVRSDAYRARFAPSGMHPVESNTPADFDAYIRREIARHKERTGEEVRATRPPRWRAARSGSAAAAGRGARAASGRCIRCGTGRGAAIPGSPARRNR